MYYKHENIESLLKLLKTRDSGVNTYVEVDSKGVPIMSSREWSSVTQIQNRIIIGFDKLTKVYINDNEQLKLEL